MKRSIIYIDESGDLGFDFFKNGTSKYLVITALVCFGDLSARDINNAVKKTLTWENKHRKKGHLTELKASKTSIAVKKYFFKHIKDYSHWGVYAIIVDKKKWLLSRKKKIRVDLFYDEVLLRLLQLLPVDSKMSIVIDKSKNSYAVDLLNAKIFQSFRDKNVELLVRHERSYHEPGLQAVDLFCWGIAKHYEHANSEWYEIFCERILGEF